MASTHPAPPPPSVPPQGPLPPQPGAAWAAPEGPSVGTPRWRVVTGWTVALVLLPVLVVVGRYLVENAGWGLFIYLFMGSWVHAGAGLLVGLSLLLLPRANPVWERRPGLFLGRPLTWALVMCWASGLLWGVMFPDGGDAPDSSTAPSPLVALLGKQAAIQVAGASSLVLLAVTMLSGLAVVVMVARRRITAAREAAR